MSHRSCQLVIMLLLLAGNFACATVSDSRLPQCEAIEALPALPEAACMENAKAAAFRDRLRDSIDTDAGPLLVRAILNEASRVESLCVESTQFPRGWRAARDLSQRMNGIAEIAGGPVCLASRRFDLNRGAAKLAEVRMLRLSCNSDMGTLTREAEGIVDMSSSDDVLDNIACINRDADWVAMKQSGLGRISIFAKPEVTAPSVVDARVVRKSCFKLEGFEARVSCIEAFGWELLD